MFDEAKLSAVIINREGNQWISLTGFSPILKVGSQKPAEKVTVLEVEKSKFSGWGSNP